ncbi:MAG: Gmad2 immunoglobulin-like domain-containing protein [bacterium]|nr:Gmad2 immunoglobulin-like domain-containing protein [bacterium]
MTKFGKTIIFVIVLVIVGVIIFFLQRKAPVVVAPEETPVVEVPIVEEPSKEEPIVTTIPNRPMSGNVADLVSFSIKPNTKVPKGILSYRGSIKGAYFFEANILINILDANKKLLKASNAMATTEWMTVEPVEFEGNISFAGLPSGPAYFEIHNDNPSGLPENDKSVLIPIIIE